MKVESRKRRDTGSREESLSCTKLASPNSDFALVKSGAHGNTRLSVFKIALLNTVIFGMNSSTVEGDRLDSITGCSYEEQYYHLLYETEASMLDKNSAHRKPIASPAYSICLFVLFRPADGPISNQRQASVLASREWSATLN